MFCGVRGKLPARSSVQDENQTISFPSFKTNSTEEQQQERKKSDFSATHKSEQKIAHMVYAQFAAHL